MGSAPKLGILDLVPVRPGRNPGDAIRDTLRLAELADTLGYHRYWLAEHHGSPLLACPSPELLVGQLAARTSRMRVGTGGVLLSHYSPLKVAENFRVLEALFPGRIDLGLCRATASGGASGAAGAAPAAEFPRRVASLMAHLEVRPALDETQPISPAIPAVTTTPEVWLLGSGTESARVAATLGASFSFAHFITPNGGADVIGAYSQMFTPSAHQHRPRTSLSVSVVCHERASVARRLFDRDSVYYARLELGERPSYPGLDEVARERFTADELELVENELSRTVVGTPARVREQLLDLAARHGVDELVLRSTSPDPQVRERTFTLVAQAFQLADAAGQAA